MKLYKKSLMIVFLFISACICCAQNLYEFENNEYVFVAYYSDIRSPPFIFSLKNKLFYYDIPELDDAKIENDFHIKESVQGSYILENNNSFTYLHCGDKKFLVLSEKSRMCVLINCENNDAFFGFNGIF